MSFKLCQETELKASIGKIIDRVVQIATPWFKPITVTTQKKKKNQSTKIQRTPEFTWFGYMPTSMGDDKEKVSK